MAKFAGSGNPSYIVSYNQRLSGALVDEAGAMKFETNISKPTRIGYVAVGAVLIAIPFAATWEGWIRLLFPVLGAISVVEGLVGW